MTTLLTQFVNLLGAVLLILWNFHLDPVEPRAVLVGLLGHGQCARHPLAFGASSGELRGQGVAEGLELQQSRVIGRRRLGCLPQLLGGHGQFAGQAVPFGNHCSHGPLLLLGCGIEFGG